MSTKTGRIDCSKPNLSRPLSLKITPDEAEAIIGLWMGDVPQVEVANSILSKLDDYVYACKGYHPYE